MAVAFKSVVAAGAIGFLVAAPAVRGAMIGVNFQGGGNGVAAPGTLLAPTDSAGVVSQINFNNEAGGSGTSLPLINDAGATTAALLTFTSGGTYASTSIIAADGNEKLNQGFIFGNSSVTVAGVPYANYDVYVYMLNDAANRVETTSLTAGGPSQTFYGSSAAPTDAGHVDGSAATAYVYTRAVSTDSAAATPNADYVRFSGLTSPTFTFTTAATGNGFLNGFQIVQVPEPTAVGALAATAAGLLARRRSRVRP